MGRLRTVAAFSYYRILLYTLAAFIAAITLSCNQKAERAANAPPKPVPTVQAFTPRPGGLPSWLTQEEDGQWLMPAKDYASTRYSGLSEINTENVRDLKVAWTFKNGLDRGQEAAPIIAGDTMYVVTPYPNILYAFDLNNQGALKWKYEPKPAPGAQGVAEDRERDAGGDGKAPRGQ